MPTRGRSGWIAAGGVGVLLIVVQVAAGDYTTALATALLLVVIASRLFGFSLTGSTPEQRRLDICPRCGKKDLAPDLDGSGVRHCWACGADVTPAGITEGS
jgi:hypothetical protein